VHRYVTVDGWKYVFMLTCCIDTLAVAKSASVQILCFAINDMIIYPDLLHQQTGDVMRCMKSRISDCH